MIFLKHKDTKTQRHKERPHVTVGFTPAMFAAFLCAFVSLCICVSYAQQNPNQFSLQVNTQLVVQTVTVKDNTGKTVEGLTAGDFTVTEDGVPQTISVFDFQRLEDTPAAQPATPIQARPQASGNSQYQDRRLLVLFFDQTTSAPSDQLRSFAAAVKFIRTEMQAPDLVMIMTFSKGAVRTLQEFTNNRDQLL
jgi:VWFA-related protein